MVEERKNYNKWIYWLVGLVVVVVLVGGGYLIWYHNFRDEKNKGSEEVSTSKVEEKRDTGGEKTETEKQETSVADKAIEEKKVPQYEGSDPNEAEELTGAITYAGVNSDKLMIRVNIDQYLENGSCDLYLRHEGMNIYNTSANIVSSASTATCEGFDVPLNDIATGSIKIIITVRAGEKVGTIEGEVTI